MDTIASIQVTPVAALFHRRGKAVLRAWTRNELAADSASYRGTGGVSEENGGFGFRPAFLDADTGRIHRSRFRDGSPAPFHLLDGLPDEVVLSRSEHGRVTAVKASLVSGFVRCEKFYTRDEAAAAVNETLPSAA